MSEIPLELDGYYNGELVEIVAIGTDENGKDFAVIRDADGNRSEVYDGETLEIRRLRED